MKLWPFAFKLGQSGSLDGSWCSSLKTQKVPPLLLLSFRCETIALVMSEFSCVTLISLRRLRDVDGQLAREGVDAHHAAVGGARELGVAPRHTVERLCDVGRTLQDDLLRGGAAEREQVSEWGGGVITTDSLKQRCVIRVCDDHLVVVGQTVERLHQVGRSLQNDLLKNKEEVLILLL